MLPATQPPLVALFSARMGDGRIAEFEAVCARLGVSVSASSSSVTSTADAPTSPWLWDLRSVESSSSDGGGGDAGPPVLQSLPPLSDPDDRRRIADAAAGCVACRGAFEVWGRGGTVEECASDAAGRISSSHTRRCVPDGCSWRFESVVLGGRRSRGRRSSGGAGSRVAAFGAVLDALKGGGRRVDLEAPDRRICLLEDRRQLVGDHPGPQAAGPASRYLLLFQLPTGVPSVQEIVRRLELPRRAFLGASTLPPDRALLMCNLALAGSYVGPDEPDAGADGPVVLDPFCGSGGIILAAAALGARTVGSDIDWRMVSDNRWPVHIPGSADKRPGRGVERVRMRDNFVEAELREPTALLELDVCALDTAATLLRANDGRPYDALVCDPPYGRREFKGGEQGWDGKALLASGGRQGINGSVLDDALGALLELARATLRPGGRLVFLTPVRSPGDEAKPEMRDVEAALRSRGAPLGLRLVHLGVEVVHQALHRAVAVVERVEDLSKLDPL